MYILKTQYVHEEFVFRPLHLPMWPLLSLEQIFVCTSFWFLAGNIVRLLDHGGIPALEPSTFPCCHGLLPDLAGPEGCVSR